MLTFAWFSIYKRKVLIYNFYLFQLAWRRGKICAVSLTGTFQALSLQP